MDYNIEYMKLKWVEHSKGRLSGGTMHFIINMVSEKTGIHFIDLLIILGGKESE